MRISSKKGDLAISTNAIVVLIIAVIMLGLIIGFVTKGFGSISKSFESKFSEIADPTPATAAEPITVSGTTIVSAGTQAPFKVSLFNTNTTLTTALVPIITCPTGDITVTSEQANPQSIAPLTVSKPYQIIISVAKSATSGKKVCSVVSYTAAVPDATHVYDLTKVQSSSDIILEVS